MRKLFIVIALLFFTSSIFSQSKLKRDIMEAKQTLIVNGYSITGISNDSIITIADSLQLVTQYAMKKYVDDNGSFIPDGVTITPTGGAVDTSLIATKTDLLNVSVDTVLEIATKYDLTQKPDFYSTDGTLPANRTVDLDGNDLLFKSNLGNFGFGDVLATGEPFLFQRNDNSILFPDNYYNVRSNLTLESGSETALRRGAILGNINTDALATEDYGAIWGLYGLGYHNGSGTITSFEGTHSILDNRGSGTITEGFGVFSSVQQTGTGTITESANYVADIPGAGVATGTWGDHYGFKMVSSADLQSNLFGLYVDLTNGSNVLNGTTTSIGTTTLDENFGLYVGGTGRGIRVGDNLQMKSDGGTAVEMSSTGDYLFYTDNPITNLPAGVPKFSISSTNSYLNSNLSVNHNNTGLYTLDVRDPNASLSLLSNSTNSALAAQFIMGESGTVWGSNLIGFRHLYDGSQNEYYFERGNGATTGKVMTFFRDNSNVRLNGYGGGTVTGTPTKYLAVESDGDVIEVDGVTDNLYTADGTLPANRTITSTGQSLTYSALDGNDINIATFADSNIDFALTDSGTSAIGNYNFTPEQFKVTSAPVKIISPVDEQLLLGSNETNATLKEAGVAGLHYTNSEEPVAALYLQSSSAANSLRFGGGDSDLNAVTVMDFHTAANNTTPNGTRAMRIDGSQNVQIGTSTATNEKLQVSGSVRIEDVLKLDPLSTVPSTPSAGTIYMDDGTNSDSGGNELLYYNGSGWISTASFTGWADYADGTYTSGSPLSVSAGTKVTLPNDGATIIDSQIPIDIDSMYTIADSTITGRNGDGLNILIEFSVEPTTAADTRITTSIDIGGAVGEIYKRDFVLSKGNGVEHYYSASFSGYTLSTWETNGGKVKVMATGGGVEIYDIRYVLTRTHKAR